ncbi:MAG TPA: 4-alpha-glucanotransferase [Terriglobia bacterium]|nr:4-alpha-glucanotransferase [Terriglobia bacterium]
MRRARHSRREPRKYPSLHRLAALYGVETAYLDVHGRRKVASPEGLVQILRALGAPLASVEDLPAAIRERCEADWRAIAPPVAVAWDGGPARIELHLDAAHANASGDCEIELESGECQSWKINLADLGARDAVQVEGVQYVSKTLLLQDKLPMGYHKLRLQMPGVAAETLVISAPARAYQPPGWGEAVPGNCRPWGVFLPLHALWSERCWGTGDFGDLDALLDWTHELGGSAVATLPLLATFLDRPFDPSPYAPASRLFWNELYVDVKRLPEFHDSLSAQARLNSAEVPRELKVLRAGRRVDYRRAMAVKRRVIEPLAREFFGEGDGVAQLARETDRAQAFRRFVESNPQAEDYARFRAVGERERRPWIVWPESLRAGNIQPGDYDARARNYHLYAQWVVSEQLGALAAKARQNPPGLCLDLPLGLHPAGYDVWRHRDSYVLDVTAGAPPDIVFTGGQNWGFPPLHPDPRRQAGYRYYIDCLRQQLRLAGLVRVDHVMGLHRLFWIPRGYDPTHGAYVRYPAEHLYAILCLESHRHQSVIAGENLGIVPRYVNPTMARHNIKRMYVVQYGLSGQDRLRPVDTDSIASLNTHDMPPFAAFWEGLDIQDRRALGFLAERPAVAERRLRARVRKFMTAFFMHRGQLKSATANSKRCRPEIVRAFLSFLSSSPAELVLVNLEDLWMERKPQNVPGTNRQRPNWRRKARHSLEAFCQMPQVLDILREVKRQRSSGPADGGKR